MKRLAAFVALLGAFATGSTPAGSEQKELAASVPSIRIVGSRLAGDETRARLVIELSGPVESKAFVLSSPYRAVIELPQTSLEGETIDQPGGGFVSAYRFGRFAAGKSRIVLDLKGPAIVDKMVAMDKIGEDPFRLMIDLVKTDEATFAKAAVLQPPPVSNVKPSPEQQPLPSLPIIVLDPGHGGIDTGAVTLDGTPEKAIVLDFAKSLAATLEASGRYRVIFTRSDDTFVSLADRVDIARQNKASLFISLHADTLRDPFGVRGATVYTLSEQASDAEAALYAEKENKADLIAGVDLSSEPDEVADILIDLTRRETKVFSGQFARTLIEDLRGAAKVNKNPHRSAGFKVLKAADVPSVLLELGYLSNPQDVQLLTSPTWRAKASEAVLASINKFFSAKAGGNPLLGAAATGRGRPMR